jgi:hypothetical protein
MTGTPNYHWTSYPDRGCNCVVCDSEQEPTKYVCTVCGLAQRYTSPK